MGSNFAGLTADQWMDWTNLYSIHALSGILPPRDLECWSFFVEASVLLWQYTISCSDRAKADEKLLGVLKLLMVKSSVHLTWTCMRT